MKTTIPASLKDDMPPTVWGKVLSATPVVMTVVATMLAGLSSSEMTRAQYDRSLAAQQQSKAGDQWNFFQGKKLRGAVQRNTLDMITNTTEVRTIAEVPLKQALAATPAAAVLESGDGKATLAILAAESMPKMEAAPARDENVTAALRALEESRSDAEMLPLINKVSVVVLEETLKAARAQTLALDASTKPIGQTLDAVEKKARRR